MRPMIVLLGAMATAAVLTACGSDTAASTAPEPTVAGGAVTVSVDARDYRPEHVEIAAGETGAYHDVCTLHRSMTGTVTVTTDR